MFSGIQRIRLTGTGEPISSISKAKTPRFLSSCAEELSNQFIGSGSRARNKSVFVQLSYTMLCYVITQILGTDGNAKGRRSLSVYCTFLGRLGGIVPARRTDCWLERARNGGAARGRNAERAEDNRQLAVTASPLKVRRQSESGAGSLAARRPIVRGPARRDRVFGVWEREASTNFKVSAARGNEVEASAHWPESSRRIWR